MKGNKVFRICTIGALLATTGLVLSGCAAKPGVAAYGDGDIAVTEQELGQISTELSSAGVNIDRANLINSLVVLKYAGENFLQVCPKYDDIPENIYKIPADAQLSKQTKDYLTFHICESASNPAYAQELGLPQTSPAALQIISEAFEKIKKDNIQLSPRVQTALNLMQQQSQQGMVAPQG